MRKIALLDIVQDLNTPVEKIFELPVSRLALEVEPMNDLVRRLCIGSGLKVVLHAVGKALLCVFVPFTLDGTKVPLVGSCSLKAAAQKIKRLVAIVLVS
jgi:hypothetical protein